MLHFTPHIISVKRRVDSWMWSTLAEIITNLSCNIQPISADDLLYDANIKKYILFIEVDDENFLQMNDSVLDEKWKVYRVDSIDFYEWPIKNTMEAILRKSKND